MQEIIPIAIIKFYFFDQKNKKSMQYNIELNKRENGRTQEFISV
jgi:hypothetical protein